MIRRIGTLAGLSMVVALAAAVACPARAGAASALMVAEVGFADTSLHTVTSVHLGDTFVLAIEVLAEPRVTAMNLTDTLPAGLVVADPAGVQVFPSGMDGTVTAVPGSGTVTLSGFDYGDILMVTLDVRATSPGLKTDTVIAHADECDSNSASTTVDVVAPPTISAAFDSPSIDPGANGSLTFSLTNPAGNDVALTDVGFADVLPVGLLVGSSSTTVCGGGTLTTTNPLDIELTGASLAPGSHCEFSVTVWRVPAGFYTTTTTAVTSDDSASGGTATASLSVGFVAPRTTAAFGTSSIHVGESTSVTFTLTNPNTNQEPSVAGARPATMGVMRLTGLGFDDTLPAGLVVATPNGLSGSCGGGAIGAVAGGGAITLSGARLAAGASCTFSLLVTGVAAGTQRNSTGPVSSIESAPGSAGVAHLTVLPAIASAAPTLSATPPPTSTAATDGTTGYELPLVLLLGMAASAALVTIRRAGPIGR